ncbi:hemagglutinin repeat-containing protein [Ralstonia pseudosolanacearum]
MTAAAVLAAPGLNAQSLTPDRSVPGPHPVVGVAANGTPVININAPSAAGVSSNAFTHYNVGQAGVVLNNSGQNSQTQIAGWVQGNPFLGNNSARVILNQVTSGNPSTLAGPTEIAGNRANLIIANPAGITCSGCSFIQAPRVTLTTGTPNFDALGNLSSLSVQQGQITVNGAGLDARGAQLDLLSRAMAINGAVWAERLNAVAGANSVDYGSVTPMAIAGTGLAPQVAIDVGQLGSMFGGGATRLIGTERGLGVNIGGNLAALTGRLDLSANGDVTITPTGRVQSAADLAMAAPNITNQGAISTPGNVSISGGTTNTGSVVAGGNVAIAGPQIANTGTIGAGVDANGGVTQAGSVALNAAGTVRNGGSLLAGQEIGVNAGSIDTGNGSVNARGAVTLSAAGDVSSRGAAVSANRVAIQAGGTLDNAAGSLWSATGMQVGAQRVANQGGLLGAVGDVAVAAGSVDNSAGTIGSQTGSLSVNSTGAIANAGGKLVAAQDASLTGTGLGNQAGTVSARNLSLNTGTGTVDNTGGTVSAAGTAAIGAGALVNRGGTLAAVGDVSLKVGSLDNTSGVLGSQTAGLKLDSAGDVVNAGGKLVAAQDASIAAAGLNSQGGMVSARNLSLNTGTGAIDNTKGTVSAAGTATVDAGSLINQGGTLVAVADVQANVGRLDNTGGALGSQSGGLNVTSAGAIDNAGGKLVAAQDATLNAASLGNQAGAISARNLSLNTGTGAIDNTKGTVSAAGTATVDAGSLINREGMLAAVGDVTANVGQLNNAGGTLGSQSGNLSVTSAGAIDNAAGKLVAAQAVSLTGTGLGNQGGTVSAQTLSVDTGAGTIDNSGGTVSAAGTATLAAGTLVNRNGSLASVGNLTAKVGSLDNTSGVLGSQSASLTLDSAGDVVNAGGKLVAAQDVSIGAASLNSQGGTVSARNLVVDAHGGTVDNTKGTMSATGTATINAGGLINQAGLLAAVGDVTTNVDHLDNTGGTLGSQSGNLSVTSAGAIDNAGGKLVAAQAVSLAGTGLGNQGGTVSARNLLVDVRGGTVDNTKGTVSATGTATIDAGSLVNQGGMLAAVGDVATNVDRLDNTGGTLGSQSGNLNVTSAGAIDNATGKLIAAQELALRAASLGNQAGTISARNLSLNTGTGAIDNTKGTVSAAGTATIDAGSLINQGGLLAAVGDVTAKVGRLDNAAGTLGSQKGNLSVTSAGAIDSAGGKLVAAQAVSLTGTGLGNQGGTVSAQTLSVDTGSGTLDNSGGTMSAAGTATLTAGALVNRNGSLAAVGDVTAKVGSLDNTGGALGSQSASLKLDSTGDVVNAGGKLVAAQDVSIGAASLNSQGGTVSARNLLVDAHGGTVDNTKGTMSAAGTATIQAGSLINREGLLAAVGDVTANVDRLDNTGGTLGSQSGNLSVTSAGAVDNAAGKLVAAQDVALRAASLGNQAGVISARNLSLNTGTGAVDNTKGTVSATGTATIQAGSLVNRGGTLAAAGEVTANVGRLDNTGGALGSQSASLKLDSAGEVINAGGKLVAAQDMSIGAASLNSQGGTVSARNLVLDTHGGTVDNTKGTMSATGTATIQAGSLINQAGLLAAMGDVTANVGQLNNAAGTLGSQSGNLNVTSAGAIDNAAGKLVAAQDATLDATGLNNQSGAISARNVAVDTGTGTVDSTGGSVAASGTLNVTAGNLINRGGSLAAAHDVTVNVASLDNTSGVLGSSAGNLSIGSAGGIANAKGKLIAAQDATFTAASLGNQGGTISAHGLKLNTGAGTLDNTKGTVSAAGAATIQAGNLINQGGTVASAGNLNATVAGLDNTAGGILGSSGGNLTLTSAGDVANASGKLLAAQDIALSAASLGNQAGTVAGRNVTVNTGTGALDNTGGAIAASAALDATAGALTNANGVLQAGTTLTAHSQSLTNTKGALIGNAVSVNSGTLANRQGTISSATTLDVRGQSLDNAQGKIVSNGALTIHDDTLTNAGGQIASNADVTVSGTTLDNSAGLMHAGGTLSVNGATVLNKNTNTAGTGMEGANVALTATASFDNTAGAVRSDQSTQITAPTIDNTQGAILSAGTVGAKAAGALTNTRGNLAGTRSVAVAAGRMSGDGTVQSQGSVSLDLQSDYVNTGTVAAGQDVSVTTTGNVTNSGTLSAGRNLAVSGNNITNTQSGQLIGAVSNTLTARGTLSNAGLIDGGATVARAGNVVNTSRLYGDTVAIQANTLTNTVSAGGVAGVIASRSDMDLGVQALNNQEHALIYTAGSLRIGGALDAGNHATGSAQSVTNGSATINADANLTIAAAQINNENNHFSVINQTSAGVHVTAYRLSGSTQDIDPSTVWLFHQHTGEWHSGADWQWLGDDDYKVMVMPSAQYPFNRYGPPFDYSKGATAMSMMGAPLSFPIGAAYSPGGACNGDSCTVESYPEVFVYTTTDRIWSVFGITPPQAVGGEPIREEYFGSRRWQYDADHAAWQQRHDAAVSQYQALNNAISAFNADFRRRQVDQFTIYDGTQQITRTVVTQSDPGTITSGGAMTLNAGVVNNVASQFVAGGDLTGSRVLGTRPNNVGMTGLQTVTTTGQAVYTYVDDRDRAYRASPWQGQTVQTTFQLDVSATSGTGPNSQHTVKSVAASAAAGQGNGAAASVPGQLRIAGGTVEGTAAGVSVPSGASVQVAGGGVAPALTAASVTAPTGASIQAATGGAGLQPGAAGVTAPSGASIQVAGGGVTAPAGATVQAKTSGVAAPAGATVTTAPTAVTAPSSSAVIRTVVPNLTLPNNALYRVVRDPGSSVLVETDPRFTNFRQWTSSDVMLSQFRNDPGATLKRIGDGFYEQQLIQQQIIRATGQRFIGDYTNNEDEYKALLAAGAAAGKAFGLNVGTALTDAQMARLTTDIVWMVKQTVTLADGSQQEVLVPQVYLRAKDTDVTGGGTLMAGNNVSFQAKGDVANSGTIASRRVTVVTGDNIVNSGTLAGGTLLAQAAQDINNLGGHIQGDQVLLSAGRDINLLSTTADTRNVSTTGTNIAQVASVGAGTLSIQAGRDANLTAAAINTTGDATITAKRDVNLNALRQGSEEHINWGGQNRADRASYADAGTQIQTGGKLAIGAGQDVNATAAYANATGSIQVVAGRDVHLNAGQSHQDVRDEHFLAEKGFLSTKTTHTIDSAGQTNAVGTTLSGDTVSVAAGRDMTAHAATIAGTGDVNLSAGRDLTIATADTATSESHYKDVKKSGLGSAGAGISYGTHQTTDSSNDTVRGSQGSLVGSTDGSVHMQAGRNLHLTGSDVVATQNVTGVGQNVSIDASTTDRHHDETHETKSSGFTLAVKSPVLDAFQNVMQESDAAGNSQNGRASALHAIAAVDGMGGVFSSMGGAATNLGKNQKPEAKIELSWGSTSSKNTFTENSTQHNGSNIKAGGTAAFVATGDGTPGSGNVTIQGSDVNAQNVLLHAKNQVNLVNSTDTDSTRSTNESKSVSVGVSYGTGGWGVSASMSKAHGDANSDAATQNNTHVNARGTATIVSGGDTNIAGANVKADKVVADVGGNLNLASVQDTSHSTAHQESAGGGFSVSQGGASANLSFSSGRASGSYAGVNEQTGIQAGAGGFGINVKGNTDLKGAYIASTATPDKNQLTTGTLTWSDVQNHSDYSATSVGFSAGGSMGNGGSTYNRNAGKTTGGALPMLAQHESSSESATTRSAIAQGTITITDQAHQKQDVGSLNRDTENLNGKVGKAPDLQNVLNNQADMMAAAQAAGAVVARAIGDIANAKQAEAQAAAKQAHENGNEDLAKQYAAEADKWKEGGEYRAGLHMAGGALVAGLGGGSAIGGAVGAGAASLAAPRLTELADKVSSSVGGGDAGQMVGNVVANVAAGAVGSVGGGSGAFMGANVDRYNRQLHPDEKALIHAKANGDKAAEKRLTDAACYRVECWKEFSEHSPEYLAHYVSALDAKDLGPELKWVDSQTVPGGTFDYTLPQKAKDFGLNQWDQFKRGAQQLVERELPNLPRGFVNKMEADAKQKMSESPVALVAQGVANGLSAVAGAAGGTEPPVSPGSVLANSGVRQGASASLSATADKPPNVIASSGGDDSGGGNRANSGASSTGSEDGTGQAGGGNASSNASRKSGGITSPDTAMRENANASGSYVDPLTGKVVQTDERLAADHIVPKSWIKQRPGFDQLTPAQQSALLNDPINTQGLPKSFNSSKGAKMPGDWTTYKGQPLDPGYIKSGAEQAEAIRSYITNRINSLRGKN